MLVDPLTEEAYDDMPVARCKCAAEAAQMGQEAVHDLGKQGHEALIWVVAMPEWTVIAEFRSRRIASFN